MQHFGSEQLVQHAPLYGICSQHCWWQETHQPFGMEILDSEARRPQHKFESHQANQLLQEYRVHYQLCLSEQQTTANHVWCVCWQYIIWAMPRWWHFYEQRAIVVITVHTVIAPYLICVNKDLLCVYLHDFVQSTTATSFVLECFCHACCCMYGGAHEWAYSFTQQWWDCSENVRRGRCSSQSGAGRKCFGSM